MTAPSSDLVEEPARLRKLFGRVPSGVTALCADLGEGPIGMAVSTFVAVSLDPPLVSVCVQNESRTWPVLRTAPRIGLSVLAEGQGEHVRSLGTREGDRFAGVPWSESGGAVFVDGAAAHLTCALHDEFPAGDHLIAVLRIQDARADPAVEPLIFHDSRFRNIA